MNCKAFKNAFPGLILVAFSFLCLEPCFAQTTRVPATCSQANVQACITGGAGCTPTGSAVNGDTVAIPAGSCSWSSGLTTITVGIDITGAGTPNTGGGTFGAGTSTTTLTET